MRAVTFLAAGFVLSWVLVGCGPQGGEADEPLSLETEEVEPAPEAAIDPADDVKGQRPSAAPAGVVPGDFPADFPIYQPSSVIQIDSGTEGSRTVALRTPDPVDTVRDWLQSALTASGWRRSGAVWEKGGVEVAVRVEPLPGGSAIRMEY